MLMYFTHDEFFTVEREGVAIATVNNTTGEVETKRPLTRSERTMIKGFLQLGRREARRHKKRCGDFITFAERILSLPDHRAEVTNA